MFGLGLEYFHLRKPKADRAAYERYLTHIDPRYRKCVVMHQYHELVEAFDLKGYHFQEQARLDAGDNLPQVTAAYQAKGFTVSSSFHEPEHIRQNTASLDYRFLSPVFSSISKQGYEGRGFDVTGLGAKIIGMGGIQQSNIADTAKLGFGGVGVLGGIWYADDPIEAFRDIKCEVDRVFI